MRVAQSSTQQSRDPVADAVVSACLEPTGPLAVLIGGAPGFGKSSLLASVLARLRDSQRQRAVWISGSIVASEAHFAALIAKSLDAAEWSSGSLQTLLERLALDPAGIVLAIDDFDSLVFKREALSAGIGDMLSRNPSTRLVATCRPSACDRLLHPSHPFFGAVGGRATSVTLQPMDGETALGLIRRRAPRLSVRDAREVIHAAGGHPAALVFLSRIAELRPSSERGGLRQVFERAAEFAGAVYSEPWASLGPQQRAVLWELSTRSKATAADLARAIHLPASHVSAQISRLVADGLVRREEQRGHFSVAPLLSDWIARRATRSEGAALGAGRKLAAGERLRAMTKPERQRIVARSITRGAGR